MQLTAIISVASAVAGGICGQLARLAFTARRQWQARQVPAACPECGRSGAGCGGGACVAWV